jgi:cell wall-associated NlpC family hydrolase
MMAAMRMLLPAVLLIMSVAAGADEIQPAPAAASPVQEAQVNATDAKPASPVADLLIHALSMIGVRYKYGGNSAENGFDCSGFVRYVFQEAAGLNLPRDSYGMSKLGDAVDLNQLVPGDLLFYNTLRRRFSHVAIYIGEGRFVHAPSRGKTVEIVDMSDRYWKNRFNGARRLLQPGTE